MKLLCCVFWLCAFVTLPFEYAHFMWGGKKKIVSTGGSSRLFFSSFLPFWAPLVVLLAAWSCHHSWHRGWFLPKDCEAPLKSSPTVKSHGGTFCLVLLHLHECLALSPSAASPQLVIVRVDGPRLRLWALQPLHRDPWPSSCFLSVTQMSHCPKLLIWYFKLLIL